MLNKKDIPWKEKIVSTDEVLNKIHPGMNIFIGTGAAEPRTLVNCLMNAKGYGLQDLTLIQLISFGDAISHKALQSKRYRLKTCFSGWVSADAISAGHVDLIPARFSSIPLLIKNKQVPIDVAFIQITPPNSAGYCSLGVGVDVARMAMENADLVVGEINNNVPLTLGDTFVHFDEFHMVIESIDPPVYFPRFPVDPVFDEIAANIASIIDDESCMAFSFGPIFDALPKHLAEKKDLGLHTPFFTDAVMDLVKSGAVSNRKKGPFKGKTLTAYALGSEELMQFLDKNPLVEFQSIDKVFSPQEIGQNRKFVFILPSRRVDLSGRVVLHDTKDNVSAGPGQLVDFFNGAEISRGGYTVIALPSRNRSGKANIEISAQNSQDLLNLPESVDIVVTEQGIAQLKGRTLRERAQALIEIAHPEDRPALVEGAKELNLLYKDQIFLADSSHFYPAQISTRKTFKNGLSVRFRAIKPSDEDQMRRLFYRFSDKAIYYRYFSPIKTMPHEKMQAYVNVDYQNALSIVGLVGDPGQQTIIAEARFVKHEDNPFADIAFVVDEAYQGYGIATCLFQMLAGLAKERGFKKMTADVLSSNEPMLSVFKKGGFPVKEKMEDGIYALEIDIDKPKD
ncbi:MAG: GNAT family N-acetyltransferase [Proteobacteria bacterium]|nr:GNAT family N-acetyltransferase [Pseudomonadota bacterium]MBU1390043.1 GNAT family N-acetyltransferase [Pseudomonadota bacterium]MBU1545006.1 GNAT family N-acetyltransferase [Pseudomonadota bacterium]MBU2431142.1 GNAT family N-acetyltransferase [Pseudomonadota bacterium]MBU2480390.1 GNAT family N-acetyltransferase [Pseudomonadota bacterium]